MRAGRRGLIRIGDGRIRCVVRRGQEPTSDVMVSVECSTDTERKKEQKKTHSLLDFVQHHMERPLHILVLPTVRRIRIQQSNLVRIHLRERLPRRFCALLVIATDGLDPIITISFASETPLLIGVPSVPHTDPTEGDALNPGPASAPGTESSPRSIISNTPSISSNFASISPPAYARVLPHVAVLLLAVLQSPAAIHNPFDDAPSFRRYQIRGP